MGKGVKRVLGAEKGRERESRRVEAGHELVERDGGGRKGMGTKGRGRGKEEIGEEGKSKRLLDWFCKEVFFLVFFLTNLMFFSLRHLVPALYSCVFIS